MGKTGYVYPNGTFNFVLEIKGITEGHFQSVTGLSHEIEVLKFQEGGVNGYSHQLPGQGSYPNIVLKTGWIASHLIEDWHFNFSTSPGGGRKAMSLILMDNELNEVVRWDFTKAWPVKWSGPELKSTGDEIAVETLEIAHTGFVRQGARRPASPSGVGLGGLLGAVANAVAGAVSDAAGGVVDGIMSGQSPMDALSQGAESAVQNASEGVQAVGESAARNTAAEARGSVEGAVRDGMGG